TKGFSVPIFWDLITAAELSFDDLYKQYVGKNVLNFLNRPLLLIVVFVCYSRLCYSYVHYHKIGFLYAKGDVG
ncbi:MAG: hypothetical protein ACI87Q_000713, partial [Pseudohongiellaceae bacterium]